MKLELNFLGGVAHEDNLTGSAILLTVRNGKYCKRILIDIGMWQGNFQECFRMNSRISLKPEEIDAVVLTHSHIDHVGRLPYLVKNGFNGDVYTTEPTAAILPIMLSDTAKILESEAKYRRCKERRKIVEMERRSGNKNDRCVAKRKLAACDNDEDEVMTDSLAGNGKRIKDRRIRKSLRSSLEPLFGSGDVKQAVSLVKESGFKYHRWIKISRNIYLKFYPSGHVLGGAICVIRIYKNNSLKDPVYLGFSGDLGRRDGIILPPPEAVVEPLDYWFIESTYGGSEHPEREVEIMAMLDLVRKANATRGKILLPSFAFERAQEIIYLLSYYMSKGEVPATPIYLDSPLARSITGVFSDYWHTPMFKDSRSVLAFNPFDPGANPYLKIVQSEEESVRLSKSDFPCLIIAGAGMCEAGRIRNHLRENLPKRNTIVCIVGYMADNTLGKKLSDGWPLVRMNKIEIPVRAEIHKFSSFSAHADGPFLADYTQGVMGNKDGNEGLHVFLVHGDEKRAFALKCNLLEQCGEAWQENITVPRLNEKYTRKFKVI